MFTVFLWRFNLTVTSQSDVHILAYLRLESGVLRIPSRHKHELIDQLC